MSDTNETILKRAKESHKEVLALHEHLVKRTISPIVSKLLEKAAAEASKDDFEAAYMTLHEHAICVVRDMSMLTSYLDGVTADLSAIIAFLEGSHEDGDVPPV